MESMTPGASGCGLLLDTNVRIGSSSASPRFDWDERSTRAW